MVLLESQLTDHRESQNHWIAGDPVGKLWYMNSGYGRLAP